MSSKSLVLLTRSLRTDARLRQIHWLRLGLLIVLLWQLWLTQVQALWMDAPGRNLFMSLAWTNWFVILLIGIPYFSSAITEEKEERTLGLLRMADIGPTSLLLGKWMPRVAAILSLLVIQLPFALLASTLGGLLPSQILTVSIILTMHLLVTGGWCLLSSVISPTTRSAVRLSVLFLLCIALLKWITSTVMYESPGLAELVRYDMWPETGILKLIQGSFSPGYQGMNLTGPVLGLLAEFSLTCLTARWLFEKYCSQETSLNTRRKPKRKKVAAPGSPPDSAPAKEEYVSLAPTKPAVRAWGNAIAGKEFRSLPGGRSKGFLTLTIMLAIIVGVGLYMMVTSGPRLEEYFAWALIPFGILFLFVQLTGVASSFLASEIHNQTWTTLSMLPKDKSEIIFDKLKGGLLSCWPSALILTVGCLIQLEDVTRFFFIESMKEPELGMVLLSLSTQLILYLFLTTYFSVRMNRSAAMMSAPLSFGALFLADTLFVSCLGAVFRSEDATIVFGLFTIMVTVLVIVRVGFAIKHRLNAATEQGQ